VTRSFLTKHGILGTEINGLLSNPPGVYSCSDWGKKGTPLGISNFPLSFHYVGGSYMKHLEFIFEDLGLCMELGNR